MKKYLFIILILTISGVIWADFDVFPHGRIPGYNTVRADSAHGFDVLKYDITIDIDDQSHYIEGSVIATVLAEEYLTEINYELEELNVSSVLVNGSAAGFIYQNGLITIDLPGIDSGEEFSTTVEYYGHPQLSDDIYSIGMIFNINYVFTLSDPSGCRWWFPAYDHPWDKAEIDFHVTMRDDWLVACNGIRTGIEDNEDGTKTHHWVGSNPMATHLPCISAANFVEVNQDYYGMQIQNFVTPNQEEDAIIDFQNLPATIDLYSDKFGEYPFEKYGNAVVPMVTFGAMEHQTMTTLAMYMITGDMSYEVTIAHELAHQWFGNCLTPLTWADVWLSEGFATYSEAIYMEEFYGREAMLDYVFQNIQQYYLGWASGGNYTIYDPVYNSYFNPVQYEKAASILHMLRKRVGDEDFYSILQNYFLEYHNQCVITSDFQEIIEDFTGDDFSQFFQQWIYEPGIPSYDYTYFVDHNSVPKRLASYVKTTSNSGTDFFLKIPVQIINNSEIEEIMVNSSPGNAMETIIDLSTEEDPEEILFDPEGWMLVHGKNYHQVTINNAYAVDGRVLLYWDDFWEEVEVDGYNIYSCWLPGGEYEKINDEVITETFYEDVDLENGITYYYKISAVIDATFESELSDFFEATPLEFPLDQGILVIDETYDGNGAQGSPTDEMVDQFYENIISQPITTYDYSAEGVPTTEYLSHFSTLLWHDDDIGQKNINNALIPLGCFLISGGNLIISGWKTADAIEDFFLRDFINVDNVQLINSMDFTGVSSEFYPDMNVDFSKVSPAFQTGLPYIATFPEAELELFTYNSYSGTNQDEICATESDQAGKFIFLGFPLYYFWEDDAALFLNELLEELGETGADDIQTADYKIAIKAFPNPFNPSTELNFALPRDYENLSLKIYNIKGQLIKDLISGFASAGEHSVIWNGKDLNGKPVSSGLYLYCLEADDRLIINKMMLLK